MKKTLSCIMAMLVATPLMLCGCNNELKFISDGDFQYYYMKDKDCYAIVGTTEQGKEKDVLYFPAYYNNKLVTKMGYTTIDGYMSVHNLHWIYRDDITATKIYFPYTVDSGYASRLIFEKNEAGQIYFANGDVRYLESAVAMATNNQAKYFVTPSAHEYILKHKDNLNYGNCGDINIANTLYMFNYEDAPNDGCFFINNFEIGGLIENTPYTPQRKGYTFDGWYKDPECSNVWNFETDKLQQKQHDENEEENNPETQLYAKWIIK